MHTNFYVNENYKKLLALHTFSFCQRESVAIAAKKFKRLLRWIYVADDKLKTL